MHAPRTFFDSPERTDPTVLNLQIATITSTPAVVALLEGVGAPAAFVNADREIVVGNSRLADLTGTSPAQLPGQRLGEVLRCVHAVEPNGCGTTEACAWCGAAQALLESRRGRRPVSTECRIVVEADRASETINAGITCTPTEVNGVPVMMIVFRDTSDAQRRQVLERMFFHDALNAAGGLRSLMDLWPHLSPEEANSLAPAASRLAGQLVDEIESHRDLVAAENGSLSVHLVEIAPGELLDHVRTLYAAHDVAEGKHVVVDVAADARKITSDVVLLRRVLGNLVKNALEASKAGDTVTIRHRDDGSAATLSVHNPAVMGHGARLQVFQRAFTTKGLGRGMGTYGSKLIVERHLGGTLRFESGGREGTTFVLELPTHG